MGRNEIQLPRDSSYFIGHLRTLALELRAGVLDGICATTMEELSSAVGERGGDTIFRLDEHGENVLLDYCARWGAEVPFMLVAEGLEQGQRTFPEGADPDERAFTLIVDPIDGTRGLMYGKRSAWALFGIAPAPREGAYPTLADIGVALQVELPTVRAALSDIVWAARGEGVHAETHDLRTGEIVPFQPRPSRANTLLGGFSTISKFFPGTKVAAAELEEKLILELLGPPPTESPQVFEDEYICSGGQLYELMVGHDRFLADLRPLLQGLNHDASHMIRISCHPYDLCTELIAREAGVIVTDPFGELLSAPLDTHSPVAWVGYANETLRLQIEPVLQRLLRQMGAMP